ncbi:MAG: FkbM family methyltransferase [Lachnospiraceae bacterium]
MARYLRKNASLYNNIEVIEAAVLDKDGECDFAVNDLSGDNMDAGENTLFAQRIERNCSYETITVKTVTLDSFVHQHHIERVDFIKADIEGAERYMLEGAKEILKKYAPKLSLCTYHLPDDPEVMKNIILKYNPNYVIEQRENKMYAYVEKN